MGLFKQIKGLKEPEFEPIAGVSLELYAEVARLAGDRADQSQTSLIAAAKGVSVASWDAAVEGWRARIHADPEVGRRFDLLGKVEPG